MAAPSSGRRRSCRPDQHEADQAGDQAGVQGVGRGWPTISLVWGTSTTGRAP
jgi:hypothetical protein